LSKLWYDTLFKTLSAMRGLACGLNIVWDVYVHHLIKDCGFNESGKSSTVLSWGRANVHLGTIIIDSEVKDPHRSENYSTCTVPWKSNIRKSPSSPPPWPSTDSCSNSKILELFQGNLLSQLIELIYCSSNLKPRFKWVAKSVRTAKYVGSGKNNNALKQQFSNKCSYYEP
jgi:hypothetical protein